MRASSLSVNNVDDFESEYEREHSVSVELVAFKKKHNISEKKRSHSDTGTDGVATKN